MHVTVEPMVQINQKGVYGVETPLPRSFLEAGFRPRRERTDMYVDMYVYMYVDMCVACM